jgi:hypothetical protein
MVFPSLVVMRIPPLLFGASALFEELVFPVLPALAPALVPTFPPGTVGFAPAD